MQNKEPSDWYERILRRLTTLEAKPKTSQAPSDSNQPPEPEPEYMKHIGEFYQALMEKLAAGHAEYGDTSFGMRPTALANEVEEEALDICGWGFILWVRLRALRAKLQESNN